MIPTAIYRVYPNDVFETIIMYILSYFMYTYMRYDTILNDLSQGRSQAWDNMIHIHLPVNKKKLKHTINDFPFLDRVCIKPDNCIRCGQFDEGFIYYYLQTFLTVKMSKV